MAYSYNPESSCPVSSFAPLPALKLVLIMSKIVAGGADSEPCDRHGDQCTSHRNGGSDETIRPKNCTTYQSFESVAGGLRDLREGERYIFNNGRPW